MELRRQRLHLLLPLSWLTFTTTYLCRLNLSTVLEQLAGELGTSAELLGFAGSLYFVFCALGQLVNGCYGDRAEPFRVITLALVLTGGVNLILAFRPPVRVFFLLWAVNGFSQSMYWGTLLRLLALRSDISQRKNISAVMSTCSVAGYLISWCGFSLLFGEGSSRPYFLVPGLIALGLIPAWIALSRSGDRGVRHKEQPVFSFKSLVSQLITERIFYVCLLCFLIGAIQEGTVFWLPQIASTTLGLGEASILLLMIIPFSKLLGVLLARGLLSLWMERIRLCICSLTLAGGVLSAVLLLTHRHVSAFTLLLIAALVAVINGCNWYVISYLPMLFSGKNIVAFLACIFDFSTYLGAALTSGLIGYLLEGFGWAALPALWLLLALAAFLLTLTRLEQCLDRITQT